MKTKSLYAENTLDKLIREGKAKSIDSSSYAKSIEELNKKMQIVRRDYKQKDSESQRLATMVVLTA